VRLYHFGKGCWGVGFWLLVGFFSSKVNTVVGVGIGSIGSTGSITAAFGIGIGISIGDSGSGDIDGVPGAVNSRCCGCKAVSGARYSSSGYGGCVLGIASSVVVVVAGINIGFKSLLYEVWVMVLDDAIRPQECPGVGNCFLCLLPFCFVELGFC